MEQCAFTTNIFSLLMTMVSSTSPFPRNITLHLSVNCLEIYRKARGGFFFLGRNVEGNRGQ